MLIYILALIAPRPAATLFADVVATATAAWHIQRSERLARRLIASRRRGPVIDPDVAWRADREQRRLLTRHLRTTLRMTAHFSLYPRSSLRGHAVLRALGRAGW